MSANLHELTKQLDVLSWNSRSVLNALIRSVMRAGSSHGFTVERAGEPVSLSRDDISRISDFYEAWEASGYITGDDNADFDALVKEVGNRYEAGALDESLKKHAQIMMMDSTNVDMKDNTEYWLGKIANIENPKWFTNTAPIPLSIRTPIYDENLSTKHFDEYETYLFPSGYYSVDTLGYRGDGFEHAAGGHSWNYDVDSTFTVKADRVILGSQDKEVADLFEQSYSSVSPLFSLTGGNNSFAYGKYSISYGKGTQSYGDASAAVGGLNNTTYGVYSGVFAGRDNAVTGGSSAILGGIENKVIGSMSFASNTSNHVGGYNYTFVRRVIGNEPSTECAPEYIDANGCLYKLATTESSTGSVSLGLDEIFIPSSEVKNSMVGQNLNFSTGVDDGDPNKTKTPFDFRINDRVILHSFSLYGESNNDDVQNRAVSTLMAKVAEVRSIDGGYIVRLDKKLDSDNIAGLSGSSVVAGYICRQASMGFYELNPNFSFFDLEASPNMLLSRHKALTTSSCGAVGYNNISCGASQFVVGSSNLELQRPRFIVGVGSTSYITNDEVSLFRHNALVVAPEYTYGTTTAKNVMFGASNFSTVDITEFGDGSIAGGDYPLAHNCRLNDEDYYLYGIEKYAGFYAYADDESSGDRSLLRVFNEKALLSCGQNGIQMQRPDTYAYNNTMNVRTDIFSCDGSIAVHASHYSDSRPNPSDGIGWETYANIFDGWADGQHNIELWAEHEIGICANQKLMLTAGSVADSVEISEPGFGQGDIEIRAFGYKSLTAWPLGYQSSYGDTPDLDMKRYEGLFAYPINHTKINRSLDTVTDCGHYYAINSSDLSGIDDSDTDFGHILSRRNFTTMHMIVSSHPAYTDNQLDGFDVASLVLPGGLPTAVNSRNSSADLPHPFVSIAHVNADADKTSRTNPSDVSGGFIVKELAYRSDAETYSAKVLNNVGVPAYTTYPYQALDENPLVNYATDGGYEVSDFYLQSLKSISDELVVYHDCNGTEHITQGSRYANTIIRNPASFANYAGECTTVKVMKSYDSEVYGEQYFVNGVKINPLMRAVLYAKGQGDNKSHIYGISYMAYASHEISLGTEIDDIYEHQLITTAHSTSKPITLHTSKFSNGVPGTDARTDMYNVWWLYMNDNSIKWCPVITDLVVAYSGGKLIIDFNLRCDIFNESRHNSLPVTISTETETLNKYKFDDRALILPPWNNEYITSVYLDLPIDPSIGNYLFNVPRVRLFGYCVGIGQPSYGVSGEYLRESTPLGYEMGTVVTQLPYECPLVRINLNTITRLNNYKSAVVPIHLEGLVNYEY